MFESLRDPEANGSFAEQRRQLVEWIARAGISDRRVLQAMERVPRERFVDERERSVAYRDHALPIDCGQTISQPYTVAFMCEAMRLTGSERVLEIGTGSGYNAAILSELAAEVYSIERIPHLAEQAMRRLNELGCRNIHVATGDGTLGWPDGAPFDAITVTAAAKVLPQAYVDQLAEGGRIVIPIGSPEEGQTMFRYTKRCGRIDEEQLGRFQFVPLIGRHGWNDGGQSS
jgi:protein-L-isoaspartate(D-aspartate) O-methyltransferase